MLVHLNLKRKKLHLMTWIKFQVINGCWGVLFPRSQEYYYQLSDVILQCVFFSYCITCLAFVYYGIH